jgi:hypothetical protein
LPCANMDASDGKGVVWLGGAELHFTSMA